MSLPIDLPFDDLAFEQVARFRPVEIVSSVGAEPATSGACGLVTPFAALEVELSEVGPVSVGLDGQVPIEVRWDGGARIALFLDGRRVARRRVRRVRRMPQALALVLNENQLTLLGRYGERWWPMFTERDRIRAVIDLRDPATLSGYRWTWAGQVSGARHGPFGMVGLRDPHLVQHADGSPYVRDGRLYLTWTCAGLGGFRQAHWGVFSFDPDQLAEPADLRPESHLVIRRGGRLYGDAAGQLVRDGTEWIVAVSSWGDFRPDRGPQVWHARSRADLVAGQHVLDVDRASLPTTTPGSWDPSLLRTAEGWLVAYVEGISLDPFRFRPALARTTGDDPFTDLVAVGSVDASQCEGPKLVERDGRPWLVASDARARRFPVLDCEDLGDAGSLRAPYPSNIPHPQLVERTDGSFLMVTFDDQRLEPRRRETGRRPVLGYGTHGDVVVLRAPGGEDR